jgi:hypothetical protein
MGLMGLWHGLALNYIVYGLYHGTLLVVHDLFSRWNRQRQLFTGRLWTAASIFITFNVVCFGLLIFSGHVLGAASAPASLSPADTPNITPTLGPTPTLQFTPTPAFRSTPRPTPTLPPRTGSNLFRNVNGLIRENGSSDCGPISSSDRHVETLAHRAGQTCADRI